MKLHNQKLSVFYWYDLTSGSLIFAAYNLSENSLFKNDQNVQVSDSSAS